MEKIIVPIFGMLVPISMFAMIAALVIVPRYFRSRDRERLQQTLRAAIDKGQPLPPEMVEAMARETRPTSTPYHDMRQGIVWVAIAVGLGLMGYWIGFDEPDAFRPMLGVAALPGCIGVAFIVMALIGRGRK